MPGWYGVDLDGTLAEYHGWVAPDSIGEPIAPMVTRVKQWLAKGIQVKIFTARVSVPKQREVVVKAIEAWCLKHIGQKLEVTCEKDLGMIVLYDDRCMRVQKNTGMLIGPWD